MLPGGAVHDTGESGIQQIADVLGVVERAPVGRLSIAPDGLLEIGALVLRNGRVYMVPRHGVSDEHLSVLIMEAQNAAIVGPDFHWRRCGVSWTTAVTVQSTSFSESRTACSSVGASGRRMARLPQARV